MNWKHVLGITLMGIGGIISFPQLLSANNADVPNGLLVRARGNDKVYYMEDGEKRHIWSPQMLESQFRWDDVVVTSPTDLKAIPTGDKMTFRDGSLLTDGKQGVYVIAEEKRRPIQSIEAFDEMGYKWENIISVSTQELKAHEEGQPLTVDDPYPNGTLLLASNDEMYVVEDGQKRYIPSPLIFEARYRWESAIEVSDRELQMYPRGNDEYYPDGLLIHDDQGVFLMQDNRRRPIASPPIFESYGLNWSKVRRATDFEMSLIPEGQLFRDVKTYVDETLITGDNTDNVYAFQNGVLREVESRIFEEHNFDTNEVIEFPARVLDQYQEGELFPFPDGTVISQNGQKYLIEEGKRRSFPNDTVFSALGYKQDQVIEVSRKLRNAHPRGEVLDEISSATLNGIDIPATEGKVGREQYLHTRCNETEDEFYKRLEIPGSPSWLRNGVLDGGAFAKRCNSDDKNRRATTTATADEAKYYITMRWNYLDWYEAKTELINDISANSQTIPVKDASQFRTTGTIRIGNELIDYTKKSDTELQVERRGAHQGDPMRQVITDDTEEASQATSHSKETDVNFVYKYSGQMWYPRPFSKNFDSEKKNWHERKRVLVHNPKTDTYLVAAIIEAGPAMFTDRVAGLSPMAMYDLEAKNDDVLEYEFLLDQDTPLGPLTP